MEQIETMVTVDDRAHAVLDALTIPTLSHREAGAMATVELERFLALLDQLGPEDWNKPTACTRWDVRQIVAHLVGETDAYSTFAEFRRQANLWRHRPYRAVGMSRLDAMNQIGVDDRADLSPAHLVAQLRERAPGAIRIRQRLPALLRHLRPPLGKITPEIGTTWVPVGYLTDTILTRDMWMHRLDICRATRRTMVLTAEHDGRMTALVVRDLASSLEPKLKQAVIYQLTGPAGGAWRIGRGEAGAQLVMDALDFHLLAAGRLSVAEALPRVAVDGDDALARAALDATTVPY